MTPDTSFQKALLLLGDGGNGKSRFLAGLKAFLGRRNVTALSLQKLESDRFAPVRLKGKLANICPDLPSQHLEQNAVFKQLTGDDGDMTGEHKFSDSFEFRPFARLVFSANQPPQSNDSSDGFFRRWLVLPFLRTFTGSDQVDSSEIDAKLSDPAELSGVLNKALEFLPQIRKFGLTETPSMQLARAEFRQVTDPLAVWLDRNTIMGPDLMISRDTLREAYDNDPIRRGASLPSQAFGRAFKQLRPTVEPKQRLYEGKPKTWVYLGIALRPRSN
jgi:putative DNA primase/helicase